MIERVERSDDEHLYQPKIHSRWIRELYAMAQETGLPMTVLVDWALKEYTVNYRSSQKRMPEQPSSRNTPEIVACTRETGLPCLGCPQKRSREELADGKPQSEDAEGYADEVGHGRVQREPEA